MGLPTRFEALGEGYDQMAGRYLPSMPAHRAVRIRHRGYATSGLPEPKLSRLLSS